MSTTSNLRVVADQHQPISSLFQERSGQLSFDEFYKVRIVPHHRSTPAPVVGLSRQVMTLLAQREGFSKTECNVAWLKSKPDTV